MQVLPVSAVVSRRPAPGCERELEQWANGIVSAASTFPGHLGAQVYPPGPDRDDLVIAFSFASADALSAWERSEVRLAWVRRAEPLSAGPMTAHALSGFESLFAAPLRASSPPPRWKTAVVIALALYPMSLLLGWLVAPLTAGLPLAVRTLITVLLVVPWMTWLGVPWTTRALKRWLHP